MKVESQHGEEIYTTLTLNTITSKLYAYKPKEDITIYELALITPILISSCSLDVRYSEQLIKKLPENAQRHFEEQ